MIPHVNKVTKSTFYCTYRQRLHASGDKTGTLLARLIQQEDRAAPLLSIIDEERKVANTRKDINLAFTAILRKTNAGRKSPM